MSDRAVLSNDSFTVEVAPLGAELMSVHTADAGEWLWQGDVLSWPRRAPVLFPVVGRCANNVLRHRGRSYPAVTAHGFAPNSTFSQISKEATSCLFRLVADFETRKLFPFEFQLDVMFSIHGRSVRQSATIKNTGGEIMPASVGFHPGFQWPLPPHGDFARAPVDAHVLKFASDEPAPVRRLIGNLLSADACPSPIDRRVLSLSHALFHNGAIILDRPVSRSVWFGVPGQPGVRVDFLDLPHLGIWTLPGANFLCIEPWQGHACPEGFEGEILEKPGMVHLAPGESIVRTMTISVGTREVTAPHP